MTLVHIGVVTLRLQSRTRDLSVNKTVFLHVVRTVWWLWVGGEGFIFPFDARDVFWLFCVSIGVCFFEFWFFYKDWHLVIMASNDTWVQVKGPSLFFFLIYTDELLPELINSLTGCYYWCNYCNLSLPSTTCKLLFTLVSHTSLQVWDTNNLFNYVITQSFCNYPVIFYSECSLAELVLPKWRHFFIYWNCINFFF